MTKGKGAVHLTDEGPKKCEAEVRDCPVKFDGNPTMHFQSAEEAQQAFERHHQKKALGSLRKARTKSIMKKLVMAGGVMTMGFTMTACGQTASADAPVEDSRPVAQRLREDVGREVKKKMSDTLRTTLYGPDKEKHKVSGEEPQAPAPQESPAPQAPQEQPQAPSVNLPSEEQLQEGARSLGEKASQWGDKASQWGSELKQGWDAAGSADGASQSAPSGDTIYFQGRPVKKPSTQELQRARDILKKLPVQRELTDKEAPYNRAEQYGRGFATGVVGRLERRDVTEGEFRNSSPQARAVGGSFVDPYTGKRISVSTQVNNDTDVDHLVPLKEATQSGMDMRMPQGDHDARGRKAADLRKQLANDPNNLLVVSSSANRAKGDKDPAQWLPSDAWSAPQNPRSYEAEAVDCLYAMKTIEVKNDYKLSVDQREASALNDVLSSRCSS